MCVWKAMCIWQCGSVGVWQRWCVVRWCGCPWFVLVLLVGSCCSHQPLSSMLQSSCSPHITRIHYKRTSFARNRHHRGLVTWHQIRDHPPNQRLLVPPSWLPFVFLQRPLWKGSTH